MYSALRFFVVLLMPSKSVLFSFGFKRKNKFKKAKLRIDSVYYFFFSFEKLFHLLKANFSIKKNIKITNIFIKIKSI
jgi:hypothetical protein